MTLILPFVYTLLISLSISIISKKRLCFVLPMSIIAISLIIMISGYIGDLRIGIFVNLFPILFSLYLLLKKKRNLESLISSHNAIIIVIYIIFFIYIGYYYKYAHYNWPDEYAHWGPMVKGMIQYNKLYCYLPINNMHPDYPPLLQCFEYMWCYLAGGYSEPSTFRALAVFSFVVFFPVFDIFKKNKTVEQIAYSAVIVMVIVMLNAIPYKYLFSYLYWIYLDFTIATIFAISLFIIIYFDRECKLSDNFYKTLIVLYLISILLIKDIGMAFFIIASTTAILIPKFKKIEFLIKDVLMFACVPMFLFISWKLFTRNIQGQFSFNRIGILEPLNTLFFNKGTESQLIIKNNFIDALLNKTMFADIHASFILISLLCILIIAVLSIIIFRKEIKKIIVLNVLYILGIIGYTFTMYALYMCVFSEDEAIHMASFERYFGTYIHFSIVLIMLMLLVSIYVIKKKAIQNLILVILMLILLSNTKTKSLFIRPSKQIESEKYRQLISQLNSINYSEDKKLLVFTYDDVYTTVILKYNLLNCVNIDNFNLFVFDKEYVFKNSNELTTMCNRYDYIYVYNSGEELWKAWKKTNNDELYNNRLYKVENGKLVLLPWANPIG